MLPEASRNLSVSQMITCGILPVIVISLSGLEKQLALCGASGSAGAGGNATAATPPEWCSDTQLVTQLQQALSDMWKVRGGRGGGGVEGAEEDWEEGGRERGRKGGVAKKESAKKGEEEGGGVIMHSSIL